MNRNPARGLPEFGAYAAAALLSIALGVAATKFPAAHIALDPKSIAFAAIFSLACAVVVLVPSAAVQMFTVTAFSFAGTRHHLFGAVVDTRYTSIVLASLVLVRYLGPDLALAPNRSRLGTRLLTAAWVMIFAGTGVASLLFSVGASQVLNWLFVGTVAAAVVTCARRAALDAVLGVWCLGALLVSEAAIAQAIGLPAAPPMYKPSSFETVRIDSYFGHPNSLATYLAIAIMVAAALLVLPYARRAWRAAAGLTLVLGSIALLLTSSRGALGATALGLSLALALASSGRVRLSRRDRRIAVIFAASLLVAGTLLFREVGSGLQTRLATGRLAGGDAVRGEAIRYGAQVALQQPLVGVGPGQFQTAVIERFHYPLPVLHAHNVFFTVWDERGLLGLVGLVFFLGAPVLLLRRLSRARRMSLSGLLLGASIPVALCFHGAVEYLFEELQGQEAVVMGLGVAVVVVERLATESRAGASSVWLESSHLLKSSPDDLGPVEFKQDPLL